MKVVVVGAGLSGIACALALRAGGADVTVRERAPVVGGRMASPGVEGRPVDMGAAYFTARDPEFAGVVRGWVDAGLARPWTDRLTVIDGGRAAPEDGPGQLRYAAPGGLASLVTHLASDVDVELGRPVRTVRPGPSVDGAAADVVVLAMPGPQAFPLLGAAVPADRPWRPVVAVAAGYPSRTWPRLPAAFVNGHPVLSLVADDGDRRGDDAPVLVAHTVGTFAAAHLDAPERAVPAVVAAVRELLGLSVEPVWTHVVAWPFASPASPRDEPFHLSPDGVGFAGDSWGSPRIETAWRSGTLLGRELLRRDGGG